MAGKDGSAAYHGSSSSGCDVAIKPESTSEQLVKVEQADGQQGSQPSNTTSSRLDYRDYTIVARGINSEVRIPLFAFSRPTQSADSH